jgi:peptidoglycan/LPS O-acetylase OafA/YrhL
MTEPATKSKNLLFESLRGLAAFAVLVFHVQSNGYEGWVPAWAKYGWMGVPLFFALSGFLIARCVLTPAVFEWRDYARNRARRILPAYFANMAILISIANSRYLVTPGWPVDLGIHLGLLHAWFGNGVMGSINGVYWTLSHEWCFYILMAGCAAALRNPSKGWMVAVTILVTGICARWAWVRGFWNAPNGAAHPLCVVADFAFGVLAALYCRRLQVRGALPSPRISGCLAVGACLGICALWQYQEIMDTIPAEKLALGKRESAMLKAFAAHRSFFNIANVMCSFSCSVVVLLAWVHGSKFSTWLKFTPLPWMGQVSYSTYLWHVPILHAMRSLKARGTADGMSPWLENDAAYWSCLLVLVYLVSYLSYKGFEEPYLKRKS